MTTPEASPPAPVTTLTENLHAEFAKHWPFLNANFRDEPAAALVGAGSVRLEIDLGGWKLGMVRVPLDAIRGAMMFESGLREYLRHILRDEPTLLGPGAHKSQRDAIMRWADKNPNRADWLGLT